MGFYMWTFSENDLDVHKLIILNFYVFSSRNKYLKMDSELSETRRVETLNLGELLYSVEIGTRILIRKLEKLIKKCVNLKFNVLFNQVCINEKLLPKYLYMYLYIIKCYIMHDIYICSCVCVYLHAT